MGKTPALKSTPKNADIRKKPASKTEARPEERTEALREFGAWLYEVRNR